MKRKFIKCIPVTFGFGHRDPKSKYNQFKKQIINDLTGLDFSHSEKIHVGFTIYINQDREKFGNDLDNFAKPVIDALNEAKIIKNEGQIFSICMEKIIVNDKNKEGVFIEIKEKSEFAKNES